METLTGIGVAVAACVSVFVVVLVVAFLSTRRTQRKRVAYLSQLKQERSTETQEQFVAWFVERGIDQSVAATVYDFVQGRCDVPGVPLLPTDPLEAVCDIVVHEEIDDILTEMGYQPLGESEWDALDWDSVDLPPPSEQDAPIASLVYLIDALEQRRRVEPGG